MRALATSADRDAWLATLVAFDSAGNGDAPVSARLRDEVERHLRIDARVTAPGSRLFH